ncbi:PREDICTED: uncharacterized protein LOC104602833 [Nelumbo nucifera]|uniref:Uncharacterized protein LOC104602833 n=2 Tax=Nelumbo nucifera TaxID=4432 RepID=A0A1U8AC04_NELNU|nr:PREDICTED: uncharacterized protein LOC104602833 [Nelumbo nucifera]DAD19976.1 TPA_asm: hypothetical protein HUJ06_021439 [Nelumbo nucifera]
MSSSTAVSRLKQRGGAGGKVTALKPQKTLTPVSEKRNGASCKKFSGKENPRPPSVSRIPSVCQKPAIRPIPMSQVDKPSGPAKDGESRVRWSTSSVPRGKSSNPSDFARFLSDLRKERISKVSESGKSEKTLQRSSLGGTQLAVSKGGDCMDGFKVLEKCQQSRARLDSNPKANEGIEDGSTVIGDSKDKGDLCVDLGKNSGSGSNYLNVVPGKCNEKAILDSKANPSEKRLNGVRISAECKGDVKLNLNSTRSAKNDVDGNLQSCNNNNYLYSNKRVANDKKPNGHGVSDDCKGKADLNSYSEVATEESADGLAVLEKSNGAGNLNSSWKGPSGKVSDDFKVLENSKDKDSTEEKSVVTVKKYPSKLHEKLAFLESKVKRIASDIKRTKEMLDLNNPDASKVILSDIQEKISGVEKAMGHVMDDNNNNPGSVKAVEADAQNKQVNHLKHSVKDLNPEELEARLFPHHKLLRNRTSLNTTSGSSQKHPPHEPENGANSNPEEGSLSPIDENSIAMEFLASLDTNQSKVIPRDGNVNLEFCEIQETEGSTSSTAQEITSRLVDGMTNGEMELTSDENFEDFDDQENRPVMIIQEDTEDICMEQLHEIGSKISTGGWFVSEGESVLLAHDDGSCSFYDITNTEEKSEYKPPAGVSPNIWGDCWLIRAPGADGCSGKYVVAASAGNALDSGFCSWDFYTKDVRAFHIEDGTMTSSSRTVLGPLPNNGVYRRNALSAVLATENQQWWYKPCGPLIVSTASSQRVVKIYDVRDGEQVMKWEVQRPVLSMDYSSPLHWRNRGKVVLAETEAISLWDVSSLNPQSLLTITSSGRKISALHVNNTDAELGGGVRHRVSSSEAEGNDGVFCTQDTINVLDFRLPSGVGLRISKLGVSVQSVFSRGDTVFLGCTNWRSVAKEMPRPRVQQFSLRKGRLVSTFVLPELNAHSHYSAITQVWGNSNFVMGVCSLGLYVFDALKDDGMQPLTVSHENTQKVKDIIGPDDLYSPSFDYMTSRVLLISRDRPALWRHLS